MSEEKNFYFVAFCDGGTDVITVVDLAPCVAYERHDWDCIDQLNFQGRDDAIEYARAVAKENGMTYRQFTSRYDSSLNESLPLEKSAIALALEAKAFTL